MEMMMQRFLLTIFILFLVAYSVFNRPIVNGEEIEDLAIVVARSVTCEPIYGFLPCTIEIWGQLFLILVYHHLLSLGEKYVSRSSDLFFKLIGPGGIFGAVTGLLVSDASAARKQAAMGMSILAGSAVFDDSTTSSNQSLTISLTGFMC